jgi:hypothetical protein
MLLTHQNGHPYPEARAASTHAERLAHITRVTHARPSVRTRLTQLLHRLTTPAC